MITTAVQRYYAPRITKVSKKMVKILSERLNNLESKVLEFSPSIPTHPPDFKGVKITLTINKAQCNARDSIAKNKNNICQKTQSKFGNKRALLK